MRKANKLYFQLFVKLNGGLAHKIWQNRHKMRRTKRLENILRNVQCQTEVKTIMKFLEMNK